MTANYVFFIGGSGARVYKAFIHGCAAGIMKTKEVSTLVIDADTQNDASTSSIHLYRKYKDLRKLLGGKVADNFSCKIEMPSEEIISPVKSDAYNLDIAVGNLNKDRNRLVDALYTKVERTQDLRGGFYAHPNIGCVFFSDFENEVFDKCIDQIQTQLNNDQDVSIALVGSVFGGTGAAGIPTIFKMLNEKLSTPSNAPKLHIGGIFLEPYFKVNGKPQNDENIVINMDEFYFNTYEALSYYKTNVFKQRFQSIYLLGQSILDTVNNDYVSSGNKQKNKPHIIELYAALAIERFLQFPKEDGVFGYVREGELKWNCFPKNQMEDEGFLMLQIADFVRAQSIFITEIYRYIFEEPDLRTRQRGIMVPQWYAAYVLKDSKSEYHAKLIANYGFQFIEWVYMINSRWGENGMILDDRIQLFGQTLEEIYDISIGFQDDTGTSIGNIKQKINFFREKFNTLVETVENAEYALGKVWKIISLAGVIPWFTQGAVGTALGVIGLFAKITSLVSRKK